jgi:hypothetical protein
MKIIVSAALIAAAISAAPFLYGGRYQAFAVGDHAFVVDRFTGAVKSCIPMVGCTRLPTG